MSTPPKDEQQTSQNPFRQSLLKRQQEQKKTRGDVAKELRGIAAGTATAFVLFAGGTIIVTLLFPDVFARGGTVVLVPGGCLGTLGLVWVGGLFYTFQLLIKCFRPRKMVICPECCTTYQVWEKEHFLGCPTCQHSLFLSKKPSELVKLQCSYCQAPFAANANFGQHRCGNCGAYLVIQNAQAISQPQNQVCPTCNLSLPLGAYGCRNCHALTNPQDPALIDGSIEALWPRDRFGLLLHVKGRLHELTRLLDKRAPAEKSADYYYTKADTLSEIMKMVLTTELTDQQANLTEISGLVREIDRTYAKSLLRAYAQVLRDPQTRYGAGVKPFFQEPPHAAVRAKLHQRLDQLRAQQDIATLDLGVAEWQKMPVAFKTFSAGSNSVNYQFLDPTPLKVEALRIWPDIESQIQRL